MPVSDTAARAAIELSETLKQVDDTQVQKLMDAIMGAKKIYVAGAGRSLLMLRGFAMRLMHLGFESYVTGDTTTPAFQAEDLMIFGSGSGETSGLIAMAGKIKKIGGKIAVITINQESSLGKLADITVCIPAYTDKVEMARERRPILPGGSMFEQAMLVLSDALVLPLGEAAGIPMDKAFTRHANLE